jgi:SAM-dependent methyltransferase
MNRNIITHQRCYRHDLSFDDYAERLKQKSDLALPLKEELWLLEQLMTFEWGQFMLSHKGLNGYWTAHMVKYGLQQVSLAPLEEWILRHAPVIRATQERFTIFHDILQSCLRDNITIASVPCGVMEDLFSLTVGNHKNIRFVGIDLDDESLMKAKKQAKYHPYVACDFYQKDAWYLSDFGIYDVITSNGLNIYEADDDNLVALYKNFYQALTPGGTLLTSFLTPTPGSEKPSPWINYNEKYYIKQVAIFKDIIESGWQYYRTEAETIDYLTQAGFVDIQIIYDLQRIFPTVIAKKPIS